MVDVDTRVAAGSELSILGVGLESAAGLLCRIKASKSLIFFSNLACEALVSSRKRLIPDSDRLSISQPFRPCSDPLIYVRVRTGSLTAGPAPDDISLIPLVWR